jgi:serine/threonine-protein kinase
MTYEMVAGRPPFEAPTVSAMMLKHVAEPVTPPSTLAEGLPERLDAVLLRALAKRPDERYPSVEAFTAALAAACQAAPPVVAAPVETPTASRPAPAVAAQVSGPPAPSTDAGRSTLTVVLIFVITAVLGFIGVIVLTNVV